MSYVAAYSNILCMRALVTGRPACGACRFDTLAGCEGLSGTLQATGGVLCAPITVATVYLFVTGETYKSSRQEALFVCHVAAAYVALPGSSWYTRRGVTMRCTVPMNRYIAWMIVSGRWGTIFHDTETCAGWDLMHGVAWTLVAFVGLGYLFCFVLMFARRNERGGRIAGFVLRQLGLVRGTRGRASCWQCVALHPPHVTHDCPLWVRRPRHAWPWCRTRCFPNATASQKSGGSPWSPPVRVPACFTTLRS